MHTLVHIGLSDDYCDLLSVLGSLTFANSANVPLTSELLLFGSVAWSGLAPIKVWMEDAVLARLLKERHPV